MKLAILFLAQIQNASPTPAITLDFNVVQAVLQVLAGAIAGGLYAIIASGLVLTYQASGVFNLGHGAVAFVTALVYFQLNQPTSAGGLGLPIVMTVANRAIGAPINIWNDHTDSMSQRDSGWLQLFAEVSRTSRPEATGSGLPSGPSGFT